MSDGSKFVVFKLQTAAHIDVVGQKCQGHLGLYTSVIVFYQGIVAEDIDHSTEHSSSYENRPRLSGGGIFI